MGKGDKKTKKGKIFMGSYGNSRLKSGNKVGGKGPSAASATAPVAAEEAPKAKKPAAKKAATKKEKEA